MGFDVRPEGPRSVRQQTCCPRGTSGKPPTLCLPDQEAAGQLIPEQEPCAVTEGSLGLGSHLHPPNPHPMQLKGPPSTAPAHGAAASRGPGGRWEVLSLVLDVALTESQKNPSDTRWALPAVGGGGPNMTQRP